MPIDVLKKIYLEYEIQELEHILRKSYIELEIANLNQDTEALKEVGMEVKPLRERLKALKTILANTLNPNTSNYTDMVASISIRGK
ncbi:MAG TPA: hypothetical protein VIH61_01325 [Waddliaceae bacterium]